MARGESRRWISWRRAIAMAAAIVAGAPAVRAQSAAHLDLGGAVLANGDEVRYLRALSTLDSAPTGVLFTLPHGARGEAAVRALGSRLQRAASQTHPWEQRLIATAARSNAGVAWRVLRPDGQLLYHTAHPTSQPAGAAWAGLGATIAMQGGVAAEWKWLRAQLAPAWFVAQNGDFTLTPNGRTGTSEYGDPRFPLNIDLPQRFGDGSYSRFDWGDSFVEAAAYGVSVGLSNARQHWGPAIDHALVMGTGSGGFGHLYAGTDAPVDVRIGRMHVRLIGGRLEQSPYSAVQTGETARFLSGVVGSFTPAFAPGFEIGATRIVNGPWPARGMTLDLLLRPLEGVINDNASGINENPDNGFASVFLRLAPPGSGLDVYAEMSREDFAGNWRWLWLEPDDLVHYTLGIARSRRGADGALHVLRMELVNGEVSHTERAARTLRSPFPPYTHGRTRQGLTNRGQLLGSSAAFGGAGGIIAWERYRSNGRITVAAERETVLDWLPALGATGGVPQAEVRYGLRAELTRFRGNAEWSATFAPRYTLNRNLVDGRDVASVEVGLRWRGW